MNWNLETIIMPELLPALIGGLYILAIASLKQISFSKIFLALLVISTLAPTNTTYYSFILAATYISTALVFMYSGRRMNSYKYFIFSFVIIMVNLDPLIPYYKIFFLLLALLHSFSLSEDHDVNDQFIYISHITILAGMALRISDLPSNDLAATAIILCIALSSLKIIMCTMSSLLLIMPIILMASVLSDKLVLISVYIYALYFCLFTNAKKHQIALIIISLLPFLDNGIFNRILSDVIDKDPLFHSYYISWIIAVLLSLCVAKTLENELKVRPLKLSYTSFLVILMPITLTAIKIIEERTFIINLPVPLMSAIPLILLEARYLGLLNKIKLKWSLKIKRPIIRYSKWLNLAPKKMRFRKLKARITTLISSLDSWIMLRNETTLLAIILALSIALIIYYGALL